MFEFKKYPSIDNSYRTATINKIRHEGFDQEEWVVLLKVHGANFGIWTDGESIKLSKRTSFIQDGENFNSHETVFDGMQKNIIDAFKYLKNKGLVENTAVFCGEYCGGQYPHPDVIKYPHASKVQKGVFYAPFNFFYMFDIVLDGRYQSHDLVTDMSNFGFITAEPLLRGSFDDCINYSNMFDDPLHLMFGLPDLQDNVCEGIVIKPVQSRFFYNRSRVILKNKNDKFKENNGERNNKIQREKHNWSVTGAKLYSLLSTYISENRLRNVLSHGLIIEQKDFGKLMKELSIDVWDDFYIDTSSEFDCLELDEQKMIKKSLNKNVACVIKPHFQNIVDGEF